MYEEMRVRNYSPRSIKTYISLVSATSKHFGKSPEYISIAELKEYLFHRVEVKNLSASGVNQTISAFKILFKDILHRSWDPVRIKRPRRPKPLPTVFSKEEMSLILKGIRNRKHYCLIALTYAAGLRLGEVTSLKFGDIDSDRMQLKVRGGKGNKYQKKVQRRQPGGKLSGEVHPQGGHQQQPDPGHGWRDREVQVERLQGQQKQNHGAEKRGVYQEVHATHSSRRIL